MDAHPLTKAIEEVFARAGAPLQREQASVRFSIPRNHPLAPKLLKLAKEYASVTESGLMVTRGPAERQVAEDNLLQLLAEIVGREEVDRILLRLHREQARLDARRAAQAAVMAQRDPKAVGEITEAALRTQALNAENTPWSVRQRLLNRAREHQERSP